MYSTRVFYIAIALLLVTISQVVSAAPADRNLASVVADNRQSFCYGRACYIKNDTVTTDAVVPESTSTTPIPTEIAASGALSFRQQPAIILPAMIVGTSLLVLL